MAISEKIGQENGETWHARVHRRTHANTHMRYINRQTENHTHARRQTRAHGYIDTVERPPKKKNDFSYRKDCPSKIPLL